MSRILRRPMFRGGSLNEGIMSVPRRGYAESDEGGVQGFDLSGYPYNMEDDNEMIATGSKDESLSISPKFVKSEVGDIKQKNKTYKALGQDIEEGSYGDVLLKEYLGNRPDPMGKFLINFGLNYMSARPKGGRFGQLATAAEAAKKPTEQLYADVDTDRLLKLKLMTALGKSETPGAFEKKANFIWKTEQNKPEGQRTFKTKEEVVDWIRKQESERKEQSTEVQVNQEAQRIMKDREAPNYQIAKNQAYFNLFGMDKLPKEETNVLANKYFLPANSLTQKPNSTDFSLTDVKNLESAVGKLKDGKSYVDPGRRQLFLYVGNNTFRPLSRF